MAYLIIVGGLRIRHLSIFLFLVGFLSFFCLFGSSDALVYDSTGHTASFGGAENIFDIFSSSLDTVVELS